MGTMSAMGVVGFFITLWLIKMFFKTLTLLIETKQVIDKQEKEKANLQVCPWPQKKTGT